MAGGSCSHRGRPKRTISTSSNRIPMSSHDEELSTPNVMEEQVEPAPQDNGMRCPFFFGPYGCWYEGKCKFWPFTHPLNDDYRGSYNGLVLDTNLDDRDSQRRTPEDNLPDPMFRPPEWGYSVTLSLNVKASLVNRATEMLLRRIAKSNRVELHMKDQELDDCLKSVEIAGTVDRVNQACREICEFNN